jgi:hypothetical protein
MTSQRQYEKEIWAHLLGYLMATTGDEMGLYDPQDELSEVDDTRIGAAYEKIADIIHRHAGRSRSKT